MAEELEPGAAAEAERLLSDGRSLTAMIDRVSTAMTAADIPFLFVGGLASSVLGRRRHTADIDILVHPKEARTTLDALEDHGFQTEETFPHWLFKARDGEQVVDVLFQSKGDIYLDQEMLDHAVTGEFDDRTIRVVGPEDMIVMKALAHAEETPRHWFDAMSVLGCCEIDWDYLTVRARKGPARVLSLLAYALSNGLPVAHTTIHDLVGMLDPT